RGLKRPRPVWFASKAASGCPTREAEGRIRLSVDSFRHRARPAHGTQRLAPLLRNDRYRVDRRARLTRKERSPAVLALGDIWTNHDNWSRRTFLISPKGNYTARTDL